MLRKIFGDLRARMAVRTLAKSPVYRAAMLAISETLSDGSRGLGKYASQKFKEELAERLLRDVAQVVAAQVPIQANREKLVAAVLEMARYQVLVLSPIAEPEEDVTGLRGQPGITGELRAHLIQIAARSKDIRELSQSLDKPTEHDLYEACLFKYWVAWFTAHVFHCTRVALGDSHPSPDKDWYRPFVAAMCAWEEHNYREEIGLRNVLATQDDYGSVAALKYSTFLDFVLSGTRYPNLEWQQHYNREPA